MSKTEIVPLGELCEIVRGSSPRPKGDPRYFGGTIPWVAISDVTRSAGRFLTRTKETVTDAGRELSRYVPPGDLIVTNSATIGLPKFMGVGGCVHDGFLTFLNVSNRLTLDWLYYYFLHARRRLESLAPEGTQKNLNTELVEGLRIPLPESDEQHRITARLSRADRLRRTRRFALQLSDTFLHSAFVEMFGSPTELLNRWDHRPIGDLYADEPRNGLSPSKSGKVFGRVLTLSAITQGGFNSEAAKDAAFAKLPPANKRVDVRDFLVCRGNGNLSLVGSGHFPDRSNANLVFPDTMIAIRPDESSLARQFLEIVWSTPPLRRQIEAAARTTNGTFKINQDSLAEIEVPVPPLPEQKRFATLVTRFERHRTRLREAERQADHLFQRLLADAFS